MNFDPFSYISLSVLTFETTQRHLPPIFRTKQRKCTKGIFVFTNQYLAGITLIYVAIIIIIIAEF